MLFRKAGWFPSPKSITDYFIVTLPDSISLTFLEDTRTHVCVCPHARTRQPVLLGLALQPGLWMPWSKAEAVTAQQVSSHRKGCPGTNQFPPVTSSTGRGQGLGFGARTLGKHPPQSATVLPYLAPGQSMLGSVLPRRPSSCPFLRSLTAAVKPAAPRTSNCVTDAPMFGENELPRVPRSES